MAVAPSRDPQRVREFGSWTADLERMVDWLKACGVERVVMQSTGVYWIALYDTLEARQFKSLRCAAAVFRKRFGMGSGVVAI